MKYKVKFRIIGDKPPFTVTLHEDNITKPAVITKIVTTSNIIDYLVNTQTYEISPSKEYCVKAVDAINNIVDQCNILYPDIPPYVVNVTCGGQTIIGSQLTGSYLYYDDNGDPESGSLFKWYRSNDNKGTNKIQISDAISQEYTLTNDDVGKYIQFSVTPKNLNATGDERLSIYRGIVEGLFVPKIIDFNTNTNTLIWSISDALQPSGSWLVEYSLNNSTWSNRSTGGGSPRTNVLPNKIYNQTIYFRVQRTSTPATDYSVVYSKMVYQIHKYSQSKTTPVNLYDGTDPAPGFCFTGNEYTASNIYLKDDSTVISSGVQLYFKANDGYIRPANQNNISNHPSPMQHTNDFSLGITYIRFVSPKNEVWTVDPSSGQLISRNNTLCQ